MPLTLSIRVLYFSRDGAQADTGNVLDVQVQASMTVEALLRKVRDAAGTGDKGRLLFKGRPLTDGHVSIDKVGITREPQAVHFMLSRKYRPAEVADRAAVAAAELSAAMAAAAAEATARGPRTRREKSPRPFSGGSGSIRSAD